jgi:pyrimidine operon attenuation protein / uracil phosphoribosyltransferase
MNGSRKVLDAAGIAKVLDQMTRKMIESHQQLDNLALVGIHTRGVYIARRMQALARGLTSIEPPTGSVDINLYRDDWTRVAQHPIVRQSDIPFNVDEKEIILVDDVLFTGRTVRAAMDALIDFGRPARIELAVLIDRGHRELPIQANYVGRTVKTAAREAVNVLLAECDGMDRVDLIAAG